jgi:heat-inducible transcriptional repressor
MTRAFTERRQSILKLVVQEFVETATAVSSDMLVRKYGLTISSATVRNEMAALEELGYLTHLHTSAGRVPTDAGYRFFVEHLMEPRPLSAEERRAIRSQFAQVRGELDQWIQLGAAILARTAQNASVITPPQAYQSRFKHLELIAIYETTVLLVLVLHDGTVRQQTMTLETPQTQDDLRRIALHINDACKDASVQQVERYCRDRANDNASVEQLGPALARLEQDVLTLVTAAMHHLEDQVNMQIYSDGLIEMLSQPEFIPALLKEEDASRAVERMRQVLETFTDHSILGTLVLRALASDGVHVVIGGEHGKDEMRDYSVVLSRYGVNGVVNGVLGIIGPTRMAYPRSISTVSYISTVLSDMVGNIYGVDTAPAPPAPDTSASE